jgi:hypothetical protein
MSTSLSAQVTENFSFAHDFNLFFTGADIKTVRTLEKREQISTSMPSDSCATNLFFGFFFDGTKNNYVKAETGKNHSNVARLYD